MALFGAPLAHEDHTVRACYAALAMQDALRRYAEEVRRTHGLTVQMRVGLHAGEVVVRTIDVFELVGASAIRRRLQAAVARGLTRFVGRQTELAALYQAVAQAGAGHGQVVAAVGEAGAGKSRLGQ